MIFPVLLVVASLALQLTAAVLAIRLVRTSETLGAWVLIATAATLMALRRGMALWAMVLGHREPKLLEEGIAFVISLLLVLAMARLGSFFRESRATRQALAQSESRYRQLVDQLPQPAFEANREGVITFANRAALERYGYTEADLGDPLNLFAMLVPEDRERALENARRVLAGESSPGETYTALRKDGSTFVSQVFSSPVLRDGVPVGFRGITLDVSDSKREAATLHARSRQQAVVAELGQLALLSDDLDGLFLRITTRVAATLDVEYCKILELLPGGLELLLRAGVGWQAGAVGALRVGTGRDSQAGYTLASDSPVVVEDFAGEIRFTAPPILLEHGVVSGMSVLLRVGGKSWGVLGVHSRTPRTFSTTDVHFLEAVGNLISTAIERRQSEVALRESEERFRGAFDNAPIGMSLVRPDGTFMQVNQALCCILGRTEAEMLGTTLQAVRHPAEPEPGASEVARPPAGAAGGVPEVGRFVRGDGQVVWGQLNASPVFDAEGGLLYYICQLEDVTERTRLERELVISQKLEAVGRLAGGVAHDFNNVLTVILGHASLLGMQTPPGAPQQRDVSEILQAANRATSLTRQLLTFSRRHVVVASVLDVNQVVSNMESMLRRLIGEDIQFQTLLTPGIGRTKVDRGQLEQVIMNFVVNARDAMPSGGALRIATNRAREPGSGRECVVLEVADTGTGIDESVRVRLFEPFFTTKEEGKGTGLGLATAYRIVKECGGDITVESEVGRGTVFRAFLPVTGEEAETDPPAGMHPTAGARASETVLLVEDDDGVRQTTRTILEKEGYRVLEARDGESALALEREHEGPIHLLLSDVVLPGMTGPVLEKTLRKSRPDLCVLFVSGYTKDALAPHGFGEGGTGFLQKPWTREDLREKLREVLDSSRPA